MAEVLCKFPELTKIIFEKPMGYERKVGITACATLFFNTPSMPVSFLEAPTGIFSTAEVKFGKNGCKVLCKTSTCLYK